MADDSVCLALSHHETTTGMAFQLITIELTRRDRLTTPAALPDLSLPAGLDPRKGVVISGRSPQWLLAYLIHECHPTLWVACFDPRLGAVVVATHSNQVSVGQIIPFEVLGISTPLSPDLGLPRREQQLEKCVQNEPARAEDLGAALLIVGPPDSGKSVLSHQLFKTLVSDYPDVYLQRSQWDGEGNWISELPEFATEEMREAFKRANKGGLTGEFFPYQEEAITNLRKQKRLVIVDVGGMVQPEKKSVLAACTHYIIISAKPEEIEPWHEFCAVEGDLKPVAVVHSVLEEKLEVLQKEPFLEIVSGPWVMGRTVGVPSILRKAVERSCSLIE